MSEPTAAKPITPRIIPPAYAYGYAPQGDIQDFMDNVNSLYVVFSGKVPKKKKGK